MVTEVFLELLHGIEQLLLNGDIGSKAANLDGIQLCGQHFLFVWIEVSVCSSGGLYIFVAKRLGYHQDIEIYFDQERHMGVP